MGIPQRCAKVDQRTRGLGGIPQACNLREKDVTELARSVSGTRESKAHFANAYARDIDAQVGPLPLRRRTAPATLVEMVSEGLALEEIVVKVADDDRILKEPSMHCHVVIAQRA